MGEEPHFIHWSIPKIGPFDFSVTNEVVLLWLAAAVTLGIMILAARKLASGVGTATRFTALVESSVGFVRRDIAEAFLGHHAAQWFPFFAALFFFVFFNNLIGKVPLPWYIVTPTGNINVTLPLAVFVFVIAQGVGIYKMGLGGYFKKKFLLPGAPLWIQPLALIIMPIVLIAEPLSLAVRLFANMLAGHMIIGLITAGGLYFAVHWPIWAKPMAAVPFAFVVAMGAFELFIAFIQAFIFALLSALYLSESLEEHH